MLAQERLHILDEIDLAVHSRRQQSGSVDRRPTGAGLEIPQDLIRGKGPVINGRQVQLAATRPVAGLLVGQKQAKIIAPIGQAAGDLGCRLGLAIDIRQPAENDLPGSERFGI